MQATAAVEGNEVTIQVAGNAARLFALPDLLPALRISASLPLEQYSAEEAAGS
jgi:hypothetical protein